MQTVIITGSSTGIGFATVQLFLEKNFRVIALYRNILPSFETHPNLHLVECELADQFSVNSATKNIIKLCDQYPITALINNAGYGQYGPIEDLSRTDFEHQMAVNFHGPIQLTNQLMSRLKQSQARIIIISSVLGFTSTPLRGAYAASKYALEAIADTLRLELAETGVKTVLIEPGPIKTNFRQTACQNLKKLLDKNLNTAYRTQYERFINQTQETKGTESAETVAQIIYHAVTCSQPKPRYRICRQTTLAWLGKRLLSSKFYDSLMLKNKS